MKKNIAKKVIITIILFIIILTINIGAEAGRRTNQFEDIDPNDWSYDAIEYAYSHNIMNGFNIKQFGPRKNVTRAMLVCIIYNSEGQPSVSGNCKFPDVNDKNQYYYNAIKWAEDTSIVKGYDNGYFGPNDFVTREQMAVFLQRYVSYKKIGISSNGFQKSYNDINDISSYAKDSMIWANGNHVINGDGNNLRPKDGAQRQEVAAMFWNLNLNVVKEQIYTYVNQLNITNDKIKNKYQFVFMSDLHASIINNYESDERVRNALIERNKNFYGSETDKAGKIFSEIVNYANRRKINAVLMGGDIIDSPADSNINFFKENIKKFNCKTLYTFGNHDWTMGWDYQSDATAKKYKPLFKEFQNDLVVDYIEYEDLIVMAIDDSKNKIDQEAIEKVRQILNKKKPTMVMMHVPIATEYIANETVKRRNRLSAIGDTGIKPDANTKAVLDMILSSQNNVFEILAGHIHFEIDDKLNGIIKEDVIGPAYEGTINLIKIN